VGGWAKDFDGRVAGRSSGGLRGAGGERPPSTTHVLIWWDEGPAQSAAEARQAIEDSRTPVYVSAASAWGDRHQEPRFGRLRPNSHGRGGGPSDSGFLELPVTFRARPSGSPGCRHTIAIRSDRMLVAQAAVEELTLVTRDPVFCPVRSRPDRGVTTHGLPRRVRPLGAPAPEAFWGRGGRRPCTGTAGGDAVLDSSRAPFFPGGSPGGQINTCYKRARPPCRERAAPISSAPDLRHSPVTSTLRHLHLPPVAATKVARFAGVLGGAGA